MGLSYYTDHHQAYFLYNALPITLQQNLLYMLPIQGLFLRWKEQSF